MDLSITGAELIKNLVFVFGKTGYESKVSQINHYIKNVSIILRIMSTIHCRENWKFIWKLPFRTVKECSNIAKYWISILLNRWYVSTHQQHHPPVMKNMIGSVSSPPSPSNVIKYHQIAWRPPPKKNPPVLLLASDHVRASNGQGNGHTEWDALIGDNEVHSQSKKIDNPTSCGEVFCVFLLFCCFCCFCCCCCCRCCCCRCCCFAVVVVVVVVVVVRCSLGIWNTRIIMCFFRQLFSLSQPSRRRIDWFHNGCVIYCTKLDKQLWMLGPGGANPNQKNKLLLTSTYAKL